MKKSAKQAIAIFMILLPGFLVSACGNYFHEIMNAKTIIIPSTKDITSFSFTRTSNPGLDSDVTGLISGHSINLTVPSEMDVTRLKANFTIDAGSVAFVGNMAQESGKTENDFTGPVVFTVAAWYGLSWDYLVTVYIAPPGDKELTSFIFSRSANPGLDVDAVGTITGTNITITLPFGTDLTKLAASFDTTGQMVSIGGVIQESGVTLNDFTGAVTYLVTAADGTTKEYVVSVNVEQEPKNFIVYDGGYYSNPTGNINIPGYSINGIWYALDPIDVTKSARVESLFISGEDIYASGWTKNKDSIQIVGYWKNNIWNPLSSTNGSTVKSIFVSGSDVFASGIIISTNNIPGYWKNGIWNALTPISSEKYFNVTSIFIAGNDIYVGGMCINESYERIPGYWKNGEWHGLTPIDPSRNSTVTSIIVTSGDVYVAGVYVDSSSKSVPGYWKNGLWNELILPDSLISYLDVRIYISGNDVYAFAFPDQCATPSNEAGYWKNRNWVRLISDNPNYITRIISLAVYGSNVYGGGVSMSNSGEVILGYWKNDTWNIIPIDAASQKFFKTKYFSFNCN